MKTVYLQDRTTEVLRAMLRENTGTHFLDSGGTPRYDPQGNYSGSKHGYGRHHERNRSRDFEAEPATVLSFRWGDICVTHNVYHWLGERLEYDERMQELFDACSQEIDANRKVSWLPLMEEFPEWLRERGREVTGLYGEGQPFTVNTYNGPDLLNQVLQFKYFECDGQAYVLLQIHNGCDVRGGYTAPKAFRVTEDETCVLSNADARIYCIPRSLDAPGQLGLDGEPAALPISHYWQTDDGCHWYAEGSAGRGAGTQLEQYKRKQIDAPLDWEKGLLCIDSDGSGYCPICGGRLETCA